MEYRSVRQRPLNLRIWTMDIYLTPSLERQNTPLKSPDDVLINQVKAKRVSALREIHRRYARLVHTSALGILKSREEAEDMTQEIFLLLWHKCRYDKSRGSFKNFLVMKTRSRSIDKLRSHQTRCRISQHLHVIDSHRIGRNPIEQVVQKQSMQSVRKALSALPRTERDVLRSTYYEELSHKEIANQLDIPLGTVKSRSRQALRKMRDALVEQERA
jgi:RNA polymerase sigma-70 factor, ECF subfamily